LHSHNSSFRDKITERNLGPIAITLRPGRMTTDDPNDDQFHIDLREGSARHFFRRQHQKRVWISAFLVLATCIVASWLGLRLFRHRSNGQNNTVLQPSAEETVTNGLKDSAQRGERLSAPETEEGPDENNSTESTVAVAPALAPSIPTDQGSLKTSGRNSNSPPQRFAESIRPVWTLLQDAKTEEAEQLLGRIAGTAATLDEKKYLDELGVLTYYVAEFRRGFEKGDQRLTPHLEILVDGQPILCREKTDADYAFRSQGRNLRIARDQLPAKIRIAIADLWFDANDSAVALAKAAYYTASPDRNQEQAERWCAEAAQRGEAENANKLKAVYSRFHP
jgi:hypothetical protein